MTIVLMNPRRNTQARRTGEEVSSHKSLFTVSMVNTKPLQYQGIWKVKLRESLGTKCQLGHWCRFVNNIDGGALRIFLGSKIW